jgi:hypothetical protein
MFDVFEHTTNDLCQATSVMTSPSLCAISGTTRLGKLAVEQGKEQLRVVPKTDS